MALKKSAIAMVTFLFVVTNVSANDASSWKPLPRVFNEATTSNDPAVFSYLVGRCAGLYLAVYRSSQSNQKSTDVGERFFYFASRLSELFSRSNLMIKGVTESEQTLLKQMEQDSETLMTFGNGYMDRINYNYTTTGHQLAEDPFMREELSTCQLVSETLLQ